MSQQSSHDSATKKIRFHIFDDSRETEPDFNYQKQAKRITAIYLLFGFLWILASDRIVDVFVSDRDLLVQISILKGWIYVFVTGALIYFLVYSSLKKASDTGNDLLHEINERKRREQEILYLSYHDTRTGLYNRRYFEEELKRYDHEEAQAISLILSDINGLKVVNDVFGYNVGDELLTLFASEIDKVCTDHGVVARWGGDEFAVLLPGVFNAEAATMCKKIHENLEKINIETKLPASISFGIASRTDSKERIMVTLKNAEDMLFRTKLTQVDSSRYYVIESIRQSLYEKDIETEEHAERLKVYSKKLGSLIGLSESEEKELEIFALLHDIGKIAISDSILNKPGKLTDDEWEKMKKHSEVGYRIAKSVPELSTVAEYILTHHEHWDGSGYPKGLKGKNIPLLARIVSVVDAYDAMTSDRPYRKALTKEKAFNELTENAGKQFDPEIVTVFIDQILAKEFSSSDVGQPV